MEPAYSDRHTGELGAAVESGLLMPFWSQSGRTPFFACSSRGFGEEIGAESEPGGRIIPRFFASSMIARASLKSNAILEPLCRRCVRTQRTESWEKPNAPHSCDTRANHDHLPRRRMDQDGCLVQAFEGPRRQKVSKIQFNARRPLALCRLWVSPGAGLRACGFIRLNERGERLRAVCTEANDRP